MMLGGVSVAMSADVAEMTLVPRPPKGREEVPVQVSRLPRDVRIEVDAIAAF